MLISHNLQSPFHSILIRQKMERAIEDILLNEGVKYVMAPQDWEPSSLPL